MNLLYIYNAVDKILDRLDFSLLYPGFKKYRFALYNHTQICLAGYLSPYDDRFLANTAIDYDGEHIAIWNVDSEQAPDAVLLAYGIVHEMFHCFQKENHESRFPDDLKLLRYPADLSHYEQKHLENRYLAHAFSHCDPESLRYFFEIRNARLDSYPDILLEEQKTETIEGVAEFVGLKALGQIDKSKYDAVIADDLKKLEQDVSLLFDIRKISYYTGAVLCLTLEKLGLQVHNVFDGTPLFQQNLLYTAASRMSCEAPELKLAYTELMEGREKVLSAFVADSVYVECAAFISGYDPMNMFRIRNMVYCSHFVFLQNETGTIRLDGPVLVELLNGEDHVTAGYYKPRQT